MINRLLDLKVFLEDIDDPSLSPAANERDAVRDLILLFGKHINEKEATGEIFNWRQVFLEMEKLVVSTLSVKKMQLLFE